MVSEQFALRVLRRVESIVRLGAQRIKITFATVSGFFRWAGCLNKILICLELNPFLLQISSFIPNSNAWFALPSHVFSSTKASDVYFKWQKKGRQIFSSSPNTLSFSTDRFTKYSKRFIQICTDRSSFLNESH